jgi:hypothetical protein
VATGWRHLAIAALFLLLQSPGSDAAIRASRGIWMAPEAVRALPTSGPAWEALLAEAALPTGSPDLSDQDETANRRTFAKALVFVRTGEPSYRSEVIRAVRGAMETENGGRTLALGRNLLAYVLAADLVVLPESDDRFFSAWLDGVRHERLDGRSLVGTHEERPNNWGTHAGASRVAAAVYLDDRQDLCRAARVFKGWLGDRSTYAGFRFGDDDSWQADPRRPVGINPPGASREGHSIDGVLPDDQRRAGPFAWPPPHTNYVYGALQGALAQAVILHHQGFDAFEWQHRALLRAFEWLHREAHYPAAGDDTWEPHVVNHFYGARFPAPVPSRPGKSLGWTDWTHAADTPGTASASRPEPPCRIPAGDD